MIEPDVSILVVSASTRDDTRACLSALPAAAGNGWSYEVIAVDNASADGSAEMLAGWPDLFLITNQQDKGYAAAINQAYACALGRFVLVLDAGVTMHPGALGALADFLNERPDAAGVAPLYVDADGTIRPHSYRRLPTLRSALAATTALRRLPPFRNAFSTYDMTGVDLSRPRPITQPAAGCLLLRRSELPSKQLLDERLPLGFPEIQLAHNLATTGRQLWMTPDALVTQRPPAWIRRIGRTACARTETAGLTRYLMLTRGWRAAAAFRAVVFADWFVRRLLARRGQPPLRELRATLRGDAGTLPTTDWRPWLVMPASSDWSAGERRQHCLASELAPSRRVLYADPPGRRARWRFVVRRIGPSLWHAVPPTLLPLGGQLPAINWINRRFVAAVLRSWLDQRPGPRVLWIDDADAAPMVGRFREDAVVFDADASRRPGDRGVHRWWRRRELRTAVWRADLMLASSPGLPAHLPASRRPPIVVRNACDPTRFTVDGPTADWVEALAAPRLCYPGRLDDPAFDAELLAAVARHRPDWTFLLCGRPAPVGKRQASRRPAADLAALSRLTSLPNVRLVGAIRFGAMPALLRACDVGIIPARLGTRTDNALPKYLFECLAVGKPVVATTVSALRELEVDGIVHLAADPAGFEAAVEKALSAWSPSAIAARRAVAEQNSWAARGTQIRALLDQLEGGRQ